MEQIKIDRLAELAGIVERTAEETAELNALLAEEPVAKRVTRGINATPFA